ncbi:MAG: membrane protease subunit, stomatin/prohibitin [Asgard group archaeon]|nr:membrane protease subunit, stomatin/prohibitin [Asgard group archaeon]
MAYFKGDPSKYVIKYVQGRPRRTGIGLSFFYWRLTTNIATIPAMTIDSNFIFNEHTKNNQMITLQGHFTYRIKDPRKMATILNFQINPRSGNYLTEDPEKLEMRIKNIVQMRTRSEIEKMDLEPALVSSEALASRVMESAEQNTIIMDMGIDILSITFISIRPTAEIARALEADYRENLQMKADRAIYERRAAAVEQEQKIKENELNTQITLEKKRKQLIELEGENILKEADFQAQATEKQLAAYKKLDPKILLALAMKELGENANKIGNLTITPDILASLLKDGK